MARGIDGLPRCLGRRGCFRGGLVLPYYDYDIAPVGSASFYRLTTLGRGELATSVGSVLFLFAGVATLVGVGIAGVRRSDWTRSALAAVAIAWSRPWSRLAG
jgi:hypothetical protein